MVNFTSFEKRVDMELLQFQWLSNNKKKNVYYTLDEKIKRVELYNFDSIQRVYHELAKKNLDVKNKLETCKIIKEIPSNYVFETERKSIRYVLPKNKEYSIMYFVDENSIYDSNGNSIKDLKTVELDNYMRLYPRYKRGGTKIKLPCDTYIKIENGKMYTNCYIPIKTEKIKFSKSYLKNK